MLSATRAAVLPRPSISSPPATAAPLPPPRVVVLPTAGRVTILHLRARARASGRLVGIGVQLVSVGANDQIEASVVVTRTPYPGGHVTRHRGEAVLDQAFTPTPNWHADALATLCEVAEARAIRSAFPELAALRTEDEPPDDAAGPAATDARA